MYYYLYKFSKEQYVAPSGTTVKDFTPNPLLCQPKPEFIVKKIPQLGAPNKN